MNFSQLFSAIDFRHVYDFYTSLRRIYPSEFTLYRVMCSKILTDLSDTAELVVTDEARQSVALSNLGFFITL